MANIDGLTAANIHNGYKYSNREIVVGKWRIKRENFFGPFSAIFLPGLLFSTWPPFFYLAAYFYLVTIAAHCLPRVPWRIKREKFIGPFSAIFFLTSFFLPGLLFFNLATLMAMAHKARIFFRTFFYQCGNCLPFIHCLIKKTK